MSEAETEVLHFQVFLEISLISFHSRSVPALWALLDSLLWVHSFLLLRSPELDAAVQVGSQKSGVEEQNHLPRPTGPSDSGAAQ